MCTAPLISRRHKMAHNIWVLFLDYRVVTIEDDSIRVACIASINALYLIFHSKT